MHTMVIFVSRKSRAERDKTIVLKRNIECICINEGSVIKVSINFFRVALNNYQYIFCRCYQKKKTPFFYLTEIQEQRLCGAVIGRREEL